MNPERLLRVKKVYVKVNSDFDSTGAMIPRAIIWKDGRIFKIDAVRDFSPAKESDLSVDCYTVVIKGEEKQLFFKRTDITYGSRFGRWWVECRA